MIEKSEKAIKADDIQSGTSGKDSAIPSLLSPILCTLGYILCVLLMAAPLSRILDPVIHLQLPFGAALAQVGAWLPINLGLNIHNQASQTTTSILEFLGLIALLFVIYGLCALYI